MRRNVLSLALLLAMTASPAVAMDLGRLLPLPTLSLPDRLSAEAPAPVDAAAPRSDTAVVPAVDEAAPDATPPARRDPAAPAPKSASRPRGWRSLLPGSIK